MRRVFLAVAAVFLVAAPGADAASHGTCSKPQHLHKGFKDGRVILLWDLGPAFNTRWYLCRPGVARPQRWYDAGGDSDQTIGPIFNRAGRRIAFAWTVDN